MPPFFDLIALIALGFCALLGLGSLFAPKWAAGVVRLVADPDPEKPGGFSEFRATYGGLLLLLHLTAAIILWQLAGNVNTEVILMKVFNLTKYLFSHSSGSSRVAVLLTSGPAESKANGDFASIS